MAKILLMEDDLVTAQLISIAAELGKHEMTHAINGEIGLELYEAGKFELVIMDILMPEKDGLEAISELMQLNQGQKILVVSGGGSISDGTFYLEAAQRLGARKVLHKPFEVEELLAVFEELLVD